LVAFDAAARVQEQDGQTFTLRVEMGMGGASGNQFWEQIEGFERRKQPK